MNKNWHHKHKKAVNSSLEERMSWYLEHAKQCGCEPIPAWMRKKIAAKQQR